VAHGNVEIVAGDLRAITRVPLMVTLSTLIGLLSLGR
jgi:hypothetical protein